MTMVLLLFFSAIGFVIGVILRNVFEEIESNNQLLQALEENEKRIAERNTELKLKCLIYVTLIYLMNNQIKNRKIVK